MTDDAMTTIEIENCTADAPNFRCRTDEYGEVFVIEVDGRVIETHTLLGLNRKSMCTLGLTSGDLETILTDIIYLVGIMAGQFEAAHPGMGQTLLKMAVDGFQDLRDLGAEAFKIVSQAPTVRLKRNE